MRAMTRSSSTMRTVWPRLILPLVLIFIGILILILTPRQVIESTTDPVGPRFLPFLSGVAVTVGGLVDLLIQLRAGSPVSIEGSDDTSGSAGPSDAGCRPDRKARLIAYGLILVGIAVWIYTTVLIGYGLSSLILMALTAVAFGLRRPVQIIILLVVTIGVTYVVFAELLQVQLSLIGW